VSGNAAQARAVIDRDAARWEAALAERTHAIDELNALPQQPCWSVQQPRCMHLIDQIALLQRQSDQAAESIDRATAMLAGLTTAVPHDRQLWGYPGPGAPAHLGHPPAPSAPLSRHPPPGDQPPRPDRGAPLAARGRLVRLERAGGHAAAAHGLVHAPGASDLPVDTVSPARLVHHQPGRHPGSAALPSLARRPRCRRAR
jgi:hypothetical protein